MKDIAKEFNIVKSTVSFIVNGKAKEKKISDELAEKVLKYIQEKGYKPNHLARNLSLGKSKLIGLIVEDISIPFFASVAKKIEDRAYQMGYQVVYGSDGNNKEKTNLLIDLLMERQIDGFIISPTTGTDNKINELMKNNIPVVFFNGYLPSISNDQIYTDNIEGGYIGTLHLIEQGYKNPVLVIIDSNQLQMQNRQVGYERAMVESGYDPIVLLLPYNTQSEEAVNLIVTFLRKNKRVDALFVTSSYFTLAAFNAIQIINKKIPEEFGFVSYDDQEFFKMHNPSLTAIAQPIDEMSQMAIDLLIDKLIEVSTAKRKIILSPKLIVRDSSRKPVV